jgi:DNA-binding LacI/PurR family transcriptional regulator
MTLRDDTEGDYFAIRRRIDLLVVPDDISIIGFDGHEMAEFSDLTTIEQPVSLMGEMAAWSIMERLKLPKSESHSLTLPTTLVVRNSTRRLEA